ncbi:inorganic pyrophosphatase [Vallitalea longa]|uniref:inorganic diphosphatase n=1 Tax=Vallitalea longa TaxID=2936439 RepID=A0A9W6DED5_9FIRM|nr:inorganic diphosphatase [Vallitalea longa]GKX28322.1 inorganic pyrophosphatase [Vallitalea longa]
MNLRDKIIKQYLGEKVKVNMDRPLGSRHPKCEMIYPINYGYVPNTVSGDGMEIDAYVIGEFEPVNAYEGYVIAVIKRLNDKEDKLVVCKQLDKYNKYQIEALVEFQERFFQSEIILYEK